MSEPIRLEYTVPGDDFARAGEASADLKATLKKLGVPAAAVRRISIALYEGEINLAIHAGGGNIDVAIGDNDVEMVLSDQGPGIPDVEQAMKEGFSTAGPAARELGFGAGMGLPNMKRYSDEMTIDTEVGKGTTVTVKIKVS